MYPWRKNMVIVIDIGNSLSATHLKIAKAVAKHLIANLNENDWVGFHVAQWLLSAYQCRCYTA
jgi:hypothetical protein